MLFRPTPTYVHAPPLPSSHAVDERLTVYPPFMSDAALEKWRASRSAAPPPSPSDSQWGDEEEYNDLYVEEKEDEW